MSQAFYHIADYFFFAFHTAWILFNSFGWISKRFRKYNLITLLLTAFSWFIVGIWYGWGYCFCTDWHWDIRRKLGYFDDTNSYVDLLIMKLTGLELNDLFIDYVTVGVFGVSLIMSIALNLRDYRRL